MVTRLRLEKRESRSVEVKRLGSRLLGLYTRKLLLSCLMVSFGVVGLLTIDIFSALDALTSRFIIDNLFNGELMRGRTVLLIVSHVNFTVDCAHPRRTTLVSQPQCPTT
jgi:hypothetical protein